MKRKLRGYMFRSRDELILAIQSILDRYEKSIWIIIFYEWTRKPRVCIKVKLTISATLNNYFRFYLFLFNRSWDANVGWEIQYISIFFDFCNSFIMYFCLQISLLLMKYFVIIFYYFLQSLNDASITLSSFSCVNYLLTKMLKRNQL
jgi:hypothetical protein